MIPGPFSYHRPASVADAIKLLADLGEEARPLAGGHSLIPLMRMRLAQREVPKRETQRVAHRPLSGLDLGIFLAAVGAFEIAVFDQHEAGVARALHMVVGVQRDQAAHAVFPGLPGSASSASRMPSAPGLMPMGET